MIPTFLSESLQHWRLFIPWYLMYVLIERVVSPVFLRWLYTPKVWDAMTTDERYLLNGRTGAVIHAFSAFFEVPLWWAGPQGACLHDPSYCYNEASQQWFAYAAGYYLWDLQYSIIGGELQFILHGALSFPVFFFSLRPFLHGSGLFFHGVFALSTPWLHLRDICDHMRPQTARKRRFSLIMAIMFGLSFTLVRVVGGTYVSLNFLRSMWQLVATDRAHSLAVVYFVMGSNTLIMCLQIYWLKEIVTQAAALFGGGSGDSAKKAN